MSHQRVIYIPAPPPPPPPPTVCNRIKTNQHGQIGLLQEPLDDTPGSGVWTGGTSGATGTHQRYFYDDLGDNIEQQYIIMATVTGGPFVANEPLTGA